MSMSSFPSSLPDWVIIDRYVFKDSFPAGELTEASCTNSRGDEVRVCFQLREPPRPSRFYLCWPGGKGEFDRFHVVSAHRDAVLFQMIYPVPVHGSDFVADLYDYFLYTAGDGSRSRRPSLERFPSVDGTMADFQALIMAGKFAYTNQHLRRLDGLDMGFLRRGRDDESALAELQIDRFAEVQVELHVLCPSSSGRWQIRHPKIDFGDSDLNWETLVLNWYSDIVMAVGSYLCWVDYCIGGILLCDVFDASSQLQLIPFPDKLPDLDRASHGGSVAELYQGVSVNEDHGVINFAMVVQGDGQMIDERFTPASGFKLTSWTMKITDEAANMSWAVDSVLHSDDLWKLDDDFAQLLPRIPLEYPVISMANLSTMCFVLRDEKGMEETGYRYDDTWLVTIDMANITVMSSCRYINGKEENLSPVDVKYIKFKYRYFEPFISSELPKYLKLYGSASGHNQGQGHSDFEMTSGSLVHKTKYDGD